MKNLFGGGAKKPEQNKNDENKQKAIETMNKLDGQIKELEEKIDFLEIKKNQQTEIAKTKLKSGDKNGAKQALSKKKKYDEQIKQFDGAMMMMEEQKMILENMESMKNIFEAVNSANQVIKKNQETISLDNIDKIKDDLAVN
jgi:charged multivesicular body protein 4